MMLTLHLIVVNPPEEALKHSGLTSPTLGNALGVGRNRTAHSRFVPPLERMKKVTRSSGENNLHTTDPLGRR
ncbi:MAG: hypothetical protein WC817_05145, partial [Patescibacteria group bacterium]